ncbi:ABC transporter permease [Paenarthrobacter sp. DKR-5]|uniref:ABC transporter permease n=1 Tax=Paenarthrobacter sp. DKR-5 TaxID=2835535 RepID=UPI001BDD9899|nr:ABC transporter permease [Paenarthrobacter sp. DKR-5]MBT1002848.1 ABC transporter permease [Paenarthrobacter sp. DKR-5]
MKPMDILKTAVTNSFRSKLRTSLTILAIFVGAFTLTITNGLGTGISNYIDTQIAAVGSSNAFTVTKTDTSGTPGSGPQKYDPASRRVAAGGRPGSTALVLAQSDLDAIGRISGITGVSPVTRLSPDYIQWAGHDKYQLSVSPLAGATPQLDAGSGLDEAGSQPQLILPSSYVAPLGFAGEAQAVGQDTVIGITDATGKAHTVTARIAGVQQSALLSAGGAFINKALSTALADAQDTGAPAAAKTTWTAATATFAPSSSRQVQDMKSKLAAAGYTAQTLDDRIGTVRTVINGIIGVLDAFAVIALIAAGFGIVNTLLMSVQERTREIGLMKAMGMGSGSVFALFSTEAAFIGFLGSAIGSAAAIGLGTAVSGALARGPLSDLAGLQILAFAPLSVAAVILLVMAIAFLAGTLPAWRAARQNPIDALRYE